jgi:hypothetical protein
MLAVICEIGRLPLYAYRWVTTGSFKEKEHPFWAGLHEYHREQFGDCGEIKIDKD